MYTQMSNTLKGKYLFGLGVLLFFCLALFVPFSSSADTPYSLLDLGINPETLQVEEPARLKQEGMADVKKGDTVEVRVSTDDALTISNSRSGEKVTLQHPRYHR